MGTFNEFSEFAVYSLIFGFWAALGAAAAFLVVSYAFNVFDGTFID